MTARPPTAEHAAPADVIREALDYLWSYVDKKAPPIETEGQWQDGLSALDALLAALEAAQAERDDAIHGRELTRLDTENERKHHEVTRAELDETQRFAGVQHARAVAAESALAAAREALARIAEQQPRTLEKPVSNRCYRPPDTSAREQGFTPCKPEGSAGAAGPSVNDRQEGA